MTALLLSFLVLVLTCTVITFVLDALGREW